MNNKYQMLFTHGKKNRKTLLRIENEWTISAQKERIDGKGNDTNEMIKRQLEVIVKDGIRS